MNLIEKVRTYLLNKATAQNELQLTSGPSGSWGWPFAYDQLARLPERHPWHARCLEVIAAASVGVGYDVLTDSDAEERRTRDVLEGLVPDDSFSSFAAFGVFAQMATGNDYLECVRGPRGAVAELYFMPPHYCWIGKENGFIYQANNGAPQPFASFGNTKDGLHEVIHFRTPYLCDKRYGVPRWVGMLRAIQLDNNAVDYNADFFANGAVPNLAIIVEGGEFTPEVEKAIQEFLSGNLKGLGNQHKTLYLPVSEQNVKVRFEKLNEGLKDGWFHGLRMDNRDEIVAAHGVPPRIVGIMSASQLGGGGEVQAQMLMFNQLTLQPIREKREKMLNKTIVAAGGLAPIKFRAIDMTTASDDADLLVKLTGAQIITTAEARGELGYEGELPADKAQKAAALNKTLAALEKALGEA